MDKRRRKQFKALRTGHPFLSIASFIVMCVMMSMIVWGLASLIVNYIVDSFIIILKYIIISKTSIFF